MNSVTYIERSVAKGRCATGLIEGDVEGEPVAVEGATILTVAPPPRSKARRNVIVFGSKAISLMFTSGRPSFSTGPSRNEEP